jgi:hypothetical protein
MGSEVGASSREERMGGDEVVRKDHDAVARATALVAGTLAAAGIAPSDKELAILGRRYGGLRRQVDSLYAVEVGDDAPASQFRTAEISGFPERSEGA